MSVHKMLLRLSCSALVFLALFIKSNCRQFYIDDFQNYSDVSSWTEHSDTIMLEGKSKANFIIHESALFRRAVLFTLLDPQPCGAALAGIKKNVTLDISKFKMISMKIRGQGQFRGYEFFLKPNGDSSEDFPNYVHFFQAPAQFEVVNLHIRKFKPYWKGEYVERAKPLDKSHITTIGIVAYGGAHMPKKQYGVGALEIDWIKLD